MNKKIRFALYTGVNVFNLAGTIMQFPATNLMQRIYYRYLKMHMTVVGTGPSFICTSWISRAGIDV